MKDKTYVRILIAAGIIGLFVLLWASVANAITVCQIGNGCTGTSTAPSYGQLIIGGKNGEYEFVASSTLGAAAANFSTTSAAYWFTQQTTGGLAEGSNLYFTNARAVSALTGQDVSIFANDAGYLTPTTFGADFDNRLSATTSLPNIETLSGLSLPYTQLTGTPNLSNYLSLSSWFATTSAPQLTTLANLSLPYSQLTGTPNLTQYFTLSDWYATTSAPQISNLANLSTIGTITSGTWRGAAIADSYISSSGNWNTAYSDRIASANYPLSITSNALSIVATSSENCTVSCFASSDISQWTNDSGYVTSPFSTTSANYWGGTKGYLTGNQTVTLSGAVSGSGATSITAEFASTTPVSYGGTGSTTLSGILKGNGTGAIQTALADTDYQKPLTLTTTGSSGAASFSGDTLNIPQYAGTTYTGNYPIIVSGSAISTAIATSSLFSLSSWYATTTDALTQGSTNKYWSQTLFDNALSGTTSVKSLTTLPSLSLPYSQLTGTPTIASSTLLSDSNTFSGSNTFTASNLFTASTTVGDGTQTGGLTINGGATTTGNAFFTGAGFNSGYGTIQALMYGSNSEEGFGWNNLASGGRYYDIFSSGGSSGVGQGNLVIGDVTAGITLQKFDSSHNLWFPQLSAGLMYTNSSGEVGVTGTSSLNASITGNAGTATALQNARTINGVSFNGTANIVVASTTLLSDNNTLSGSDSFTKNLVLLSASSSVGETAANIWDSALTSGDCVQASTGGLLTTTGSACGSGSGGVTNLAATYPLLTTGSTGSITISTPLATTTIQQTYGTPQIGQITLATSSASFNGLTVADSISNSGGTFTVTPLWSGTLNSAGLTNTAVTAGSYTNTNLTVNAEGQITAASNGSGGGSSVWPFTPSTYAGVANQSTTTPLWLNGTQLIASSTLAVNATTTGQYITGVKSALLLNDSNGQVTAYAGSSNPCSTNQAPTTLSALGVLGGCTSTFLTGNQTVTLSGDVTGSGATSITTAFNLGNSHWWTATQNFTNASTSELTATSSVYLTNTESDLLVTNSSGLVGAATVSSPLGFSGGTLSCSTCLTGNQSITLSGDVTGSGATTITASLALSVAHAWTGKQSFSNASSTLGTITTGWATNFYPTYASSTEITVPTIASAATSSIISTNGLDFGNGSHGIRVYPGSSTTTISFY